MTTRTRKKTAKKATTSRTSKRTVEAKEKAPAKKATKKATTKRTAKKEVSFFDDILGDRNVSKLKVKVEIKSKEAKKVNKHGYRIPFKNEALQAATGGIIGGTFCEIAATSQGGKSFLAYELAAACQAMGGIVMLNDGENAWDDNYAKMVGLDLDAGTFIITRIANIQEYYAFIINVTEATRKKAGCKHIPILSICDSFPTLNTKFALDKRGTGEQLGHEAKLKNRAWSEQMETFTPFLGETMSTHIMINQFTKVEVANKYMNPYVSLCEEKMQYWSTQRLKGMLRAPLKITKNIGGKDEKITIGARTAWETIKNRSVKPFQKAVIDILYSRGILKWSGFLGYMFQNQFATLGKSKFDPVTGEELSKSVEVIKLLPSIVGEEDIRMPYDKKKNTSTVEAFEDIVERFPKLKEPIWTGTYDDGQNYDVDGGDEDEDGDE